MADVTTTHEFGAWVLALMPPFAWLGGSVLVGLVIERVILTRVRRWCAHSGWGYDHIAVAGVRGVAFVWCVLVGVYAASQTITMATEWHVLLNKVLVVAWLVSLTITCARVAGGVLAQTAKRTSGVVASSIITNLVTIIIYILGFLVILDSLGVQITPVLTALGVGGIAVALALQDTLSNLFAGLQLVASHKINLGDTVRLENGTEGIVRDLTWRYTTIEVVQGHLLIVPNAKLSAAMVTNYSLPACDYPVHVAFGVAYGSDLTHVEQVLLEIGRDIQQTVPGAVRGFEPSVRFNAFADSSITLNVILRANDFHAHFVVRHEAIKKIHHRLQLAGIEIPFPMRTVVVKNGVTLG